MLNEESYSNLISEHLKLTHQLEELENKKKEEAKKLREINSSRLYYDRIYNYGDQVFELIVSMKVSTTLITEYYYSYSNFHIRTVGERFKHMFRFNEPKYVISRVNLGNRKLTKYDEEIYEMGYTPEDSKFFRWLVSLLG